MSMKRGSKPMEGSSTNRISGSMTKAREISNSRLSPPDKTLAWWVRRSARREYLVKIFSAASLAISGFSIK